MLMTLNHYIRILFVVGGRCPMKSGLSKKGNVLVLSTEKCIGKTGFGFCSILMFYVYFQRFVVSLSRGFLSSVLGSLLGKCSYAMA